jgi:hypothetical protein
VSLWTSRHSDLWIAVKPRQRRGAIIRDACEFPKARVRPLRTMIVNTSDKPYIGERMARRERHERHKTSFGDPGR